MPKLNRIQDPRLPNGGVEHDGLVIPGRGIVVGGGGDIPLPRPPIVGTEGPDQLIGTDLNDTIYGLGGDDTIDGRKGADKMYGGDGSDNYSVDNVKDVVVEKAGEGSEDSVYSTVDFHLGDNVEALYLQGPGAINGWGNDAGNQLFGNDNSNMLFGNGGGDMLDGGKGADGMIGGDGNDLYVVDNAGDVVWELAGQGDWDGVYSSISYTLGPNVENLYLLDQGGAINGTGNDLNNHIDGNSSKNVLKGGLGNDWLNGKGGNDTMYGGDDDDTFVVDSINDVVVEYGNQGYDKVFSTATYFLSNNVETLILKEEGSAINGYGNDSENSLYGNSFANKLGGYAGTDYIHAGGGKDTVDGGTGSDYLWGDSGDDTFSFHGNFGEDWIHDFKAGGDHDIIELDHNQFTDFAAVQAAMVQNVGSTTIVLDANNSISLTGVNVADLQASDFHFV
jgi:serralysin